MSKISLNQDAKLEGIFNPAKSSKKSLEDRIVAGYLKGRSITMIIDSFPNSKINCTIELTDSKISRVVIGTKSLTNVKKLSLMPFFLRRLTHSIAMAFNINGYKDALRAKAKTIADAYNVANNSKTITLPFNDSHVSASHEDKKAKSPLSPKVENQPNKEKQELIELIKSRNSVNPAGIPLKFREDKDVVIARIFANQLDPFFIPDSLKKDVNVVIAVIQKNPYHYYQLDDDLKANEQIAIEAVSLDGWNLEYCSLELRNNFNVVLIAVKKDGTVLKFASDELKNNKEIVLAAVSHSPNAINSASSELQNDKDIVLVAIKRDVNCLVLSNLSEELQNDPDIQAVYKG